MTAGEIALVLWGVGFGRWHSSFLWFSIFFHSLGRLLGPFIPHASLRSNVSRTLAFSRYLGYFLGHFFPGLLGQFFHSRFYHGWSYRPMVRVVFVWGAYHGQSILLLGSSVGQSSDSTEESRRRFQLALQHEGFGASGGQIGVSVVSSVRFTGSFFYGCFFQASVV